MASSYAFVDQLPNKLQGEDMISGIPTGLNACGTYYSPTIYGLKTKSGLKALKTSPCVNTIARTSKSSRQLKQKFSHTRKTPKMRPSIVADN